MSKPKFEFLANNAKMDDESGIAIWRYTDQRSTGDVEIVVRQEFTSFRAAHAIDGLIAVAFTAGESCGFARCQDGVLDALKRG